MTTNKLLYGFSEPLPLQTKLMAGPFSMLYENGFIRHIRYGDDEVVRMIYMALRDKNWGTYPPIIENERITAGEDAFNIQYRCGYNEEGIELFNWDVWISGESTGKIIFSITGTVHKDLLKNRAGFCILHPVKNTIGKCITITHPDKSKEQGIFPVFIAPDNPFANIREIQWTHQSREYILETKGDIFEMEDQRNWTDASFKTFCTPLSLPFPVLLKKGDQIRQQVIFYPVDLLPLVEPTGIKDPILITIIEGENIKMPVTGVGASTEPLPSAASLLEPVRKINFDYYFIDVKLEEAGWRDHLAAELNIAAAVDRSLYIRLSLSADHIKNFSAFVEMIVAKEQKISYLLFIENGMHVTSQLMIDWIEKNAKKILPSVLMGIGTAANFTELNRNRRTITGIDFVNYAIHPQEHAFDHLSMIENLAAQADTVASAMQIYPGTAIGISPVTLKKCVNPYANNITDRLHTNEQKTDPRQASLWNAGWTLGSLKYLSEAGASTLTYFQTAGGQGVCDDSGQLYPCGMLLQVLLDYKHAFLVKTNSSEPLKCSSLLQLSDNKRLLFLANHTGNAIRVKLPFSITSVEQVQPYPSSIAATPVKVTHEITLQPWAVVRLS